MKSSEQGLLLNSCVPLNKQRSHCFPLYFFSRLLSSSAEVVVDSNGSGEASGQDRVREQKTDGVEEEEQDWRLREELIGAFEGALDMNGKTGDLRGIRVLKNDRVMGERGGGPCFGNCEDDEGAEWVRLCVRMFKIFLLSKSRWI